VQEARSNIWRKITEAIPCAAFDDVTHLSARLAAGHADHAPKLTEDNAPTAWNDHSCVAASQGAPDVAKLRQTAKWDHHLCARGGIEYGFARNWTARVEYLHLGLSDQSFSFTASNGVFRGIDEGRLTVDSVRIGVSYLFN
jgi:opacity protein-like surface antigen